MSNFNFEFFEPLFQLIRLHRGLSNLKKKDGVTLVDLGCGYNYPLYQTLVKKGFKSIKYIGIDPRIKNDNKLKNIKLIKTNLETKIPLQDEEADYIIGFAFLEHINHPDMIIKESIRVLKKGGSLILTTPTPKAKKILEFLAYTLGLLPADLVREHKQYFNKEILNTITEKNRGKYKVEIDHQYFEFGFNNLFIVKKL